jgi:putative beta-lysine N-acetyltransferase
MTDFATLPDFRGNNLALLLLREMEAHMRLAKYNTLYTIARSMSPGMNITFAKNSYEYAGTLKNNTNISGNIESMNVWYKHLS